MNTGTVWVVIPAYNVEKVIAEVVRGVRMVIPTVVVVDDHSHDATSRVAAAAGAHVIRHSINLGQGGALASGTRYALRRGADMVVHFDGDGQHDAGDIETLLASIRAGEYQVVLGSRFLGKNAVNIPWERKIFLKGAILFTSFFSGVSLTDAHNGLRALSRHAASRITIHENRMAHNSEIIHQIGVQKLTFCEVPVTVHYTDYSLGRGESSIKRTITVLKRLFWKQLFF